jgi:hypothetical protein
LREEEEKQTRLAAAPHAAAVFGLSLLEVRPFGLFAFPSSVGRRLSSGTSCTATWTATSPSAASRSDRLAAARTAAPESKSLTHLCFIPLYPCCGLCFIPLFYIPLFYIPLFYIPLLRSLLHTIVSYPLWGDGLGGCVPPGERQRQRGGHVRRAAGRAGCPLEKRAQGCGIGGTVKGRHPLPLSVPLALQL